MCGKITGITQRMGRTRSMERKGRTRRMGRTQRTGKTGENRENRENMENGENRENTQRMQRTTENQENTENGENMENGENTKNRKNRENMESGENRNGENRKNGENFENRENGRIGQTGEWGKPANGRTRWVKNREDLSESSTARSQVCSWDLHAYNSSTTLSQCASVWHTLHCHKHSTLILVVIRTNLHYRIIPERREARLLHGHTAVETGI